MATSLSKYLIGNCVMPSSPNICPKSYQGLQFYGNGILDNICIKNYVQSDNVIKNESLSINPDWTPDILFMTVFNHTTNSANVFGLTQSQTKFNISRQEVGSDVVKTVGILEPNITSFLDYLCESGKYYNYLIQAQNDTQLSDFIISDVIKTDFFGVYLLNASDIDNYTNNDDLECFKLDSNCTVAAVSNNADITEFNNFTKFSNYFIGDKNYLSGSVVSMLTYWDGDDEITWSKEHLEDFRKLINNGQEKIMKFKNGKIIRIVTFNSNTESMSYVYEDIQNQPVDVTFGFRECREV